MLVSRLPSALAGSIDIPQAQTACQQPGQAAFISMSGQGQRRARRPAGCARSGFAGERNTGPWPGTCAPGKAAQDQHHRGCRTPRAPDPAGALGLPVRRLGQSANAGSSGVRPFMQEPDCGRKPAAPAAAAPRRRCAWWPGPARLAPCRAAAATDLRDAGQLARLVAPLRLPVRALLRGAVQPVRRDVGRIGLQHQRVQRQFSRQPCESAAPGQTWPRRQSPA
jgi:hypothetical protein